MSREWDDIAFDLAIKFLKKHNLRDWDPQMDTLSGLLPSWIRTMKAPTQCALWEKPELLNGPRENGFGLELLETFVDESHLSRELLKCKECGQLYFFEFYEEIDWADGQDPQYSKYIPVETGVDIERLKKATPFNLWQHLPQLRRDFPKDAKCPMTYWAKDNQ